MLVSAPTAAIGRGRTSLVALVRMSVEPLLIVLTLIVCYLAVGAEFDGAELVLVLIAFSITFPGDVSVRRLRQSLLWSVLANWLLVASLLVFFGWATKFIWYFDAQAILLWLAVTPAVLYGAHRSIPLLVPQLLAIDGYRSAVIVGASDVSTRLARTLEQEPSLGFRFLGFFEDRRDPARAPMSPRPLLGRVQDAAQYVKQHSVETVFVGLPMAAQPRVLGLLEELKDTTASVYFIPDVFIFDLIQARIDDLNGIPVVAVCETPFVGVNGMVKRASDLVLGSVLTLLAIPLFAVVALAVKLDSSGPVLFKQRRYGVDGRQIVVWKFRSMRCAEDGAEIRQAALGDPRITRVGRILRRTSLDELPQLINVLRGTMSLVGPRPHAVAHNEQYRVLIRGYMMRHKVKPGITGWAQVNGYRGETADIEKMRGRIEYDLEYLRRWSLSFDLLILLKTLKIVWRQTNAH